MALPLLLAGCALLRSIDHDEGQYVAAVALMRQGLPYRDFAYLQTPLQPLLLAPLAWLCEGWLFPALRLINALMAAGAVLLIRQAALRAGASEWAAMIAALMLATSHMLMFAATLVRNDALPLLLHIGGLCLALRLAQPDRQGRIMAGVLGGLLLGAAASVKISYGLPAAAAGLWALIHWRRIGPGAVLAFATGGLAGGMPTVWAWSLAPEAAHFGILDYSLLAPFEWRTLNAQADMLAAPLSVLRLLRFLAQGAGLLAIVTLALHAIAAWPRKRGTSDPVAQLLAMLIGAGLLAAWLPRPVYVQYLGPLLPALFIAFARLADRPRWRGGRWQTLLILAMAAGPVATVIDLARNVERLESPVLAATRQAHEIGAIVGHGRIVTLSPERAVDSGLALDPRFATGPFLFRTRDILTEAQMRRFHALSSAQAAAGLDAMPPDAVLTGAESSASPGAPDGLEAPLIAWARSHGYRAVPLGLMTLYLRSPSPDKGRI